MANPLAGEFPFPEAGEGKVFRYTLKDLVELSALYGDARMPRAENDKQFWTKMLEGINANDPRVMYDCIRYGLKDTGSNKRVATDVYMEDPPFNIAEARLPVLNALMMRRDGKSWEDQMTELAERLAAEEAARLEAEGQGNPPPPPMTRDQQKDTASESSPSDTEQV